MRLEMIVSSKDRDLVTDETLVYHSEKGIVRSHLLSEDRVFIEVAPEANRNLPHVRASFGIGDALAIIDALAEKGVAEAERAKTAFRLAASVEELSRSNRG